MEMDLRGRWCAIINRWKLNPAQQVALQDQAIAKAIKEGDEQDLRYVKALWVVDDCYEKNRFGMPIRRITYQARNQFDQPFDRGEYVAAEQVHVVQGSVTGGGAWGPTQQNPDGTFDDFIGLQTPWLADAIVYQTFTATMLKQDAYLPDVPRPVMVVSPGYPNGPYFGTLGHWITHEGDRMNGGWGAPTGIKECEAPRYRGVKGNQCSVWCWYPL